MAVNYLNTITKLKGKRNISNQKHLFHTHFDEINRLTNVTQERTFFFYYN